MPHPPPTYRPALTGRCAAAATTLCALHYLACSLSVYASQRLGYLKKADLPVQGEPAHSLTTISRCAPDTAHLLGMSAP